MVMSSGRSTLEKVIGLVSHDCPLLNILFAEARRRYHFVPGQDRTPEAAWSESVRAAVASAFTHDGVVEVIREKLRSLERDSCGLEGSMSSSFEAPVVPKREAASVVYSAEDIEEETTSSEVPPPSEIAKDASCTSWTGYDCDTSDKTTSLGTPRETADVLVRAINAEQNQLDAQCQTPVPPHILSQTDGNDRRDSRIGGVINSEDNDLQPRETSSACSAEGGGDSNRNDFVPPVFLEPAPYCESGVKGRAIGATVLLTCEQHHIFHDNSPSARDDSEPLDGEILISADTEKVVTRDAVLIETTEGHGAVEVEVVKSPVPELTTVCCANGRHGEKDNGTFIHVDAKNSSEKCRFGPETGQTLGGTVRKSEEKRQPAAGGSTLTFNDNKCDIHASVELGLTGLNVEAPIRVNGLSHQTAHSSKDSAAVYLARAITPSTGINEEIPVEETGVEARQRGSAASCVSNEITGGAVQKGHTPREVQSNADDYEDESFEAPVDDEKRVRFSGTDLCKVHQIREKFAPHEIRELFYSAEEFDLMQDELEIEEEEEWQQPVATACEDDADDSNHTGGAAMAVNDDDTAGSYSCEDISLESYSFEVDESNDCF